MMRSIKEVMESKNMAVFGASRDAEKPGAVLLKLLKDTGFQGKVAGVNPQGGQMHGFTFYRRLDDVPFSVDLAVMLIPPHAVPAALNDCKRRGVKGVVISSEGFAEVGAEGKQYQIEVLKILRASGMRGFGPNTLGIVNTTTGLTTSYIANAQTLKPGPIGFIAQSGIFVGGLLRYLSSFNGLQISKGLGLGNKVDVDESDALTYLTEDEATRVIGMYLEDIREGQRFLEVARKAVLQKPIILLKGGRTPLGAKSTASHTASLAMDDGVLNGTMRQVGVLRVAGIDDFMGTLMGFRWMPLPKGGQIALVTYSGAQAIMSIDAATELGLGLAALQAKTREELSGIISTISKTRNPVDMFPDMIAHGFEKTTTKILRALLEDDGVHGIVFISFARTVSEDFLPHVEIIHEHKNKPVFFSLIGIKEEVEANRAFLEGNGIPFYLFPEMGIRVFANMWRYAAMLDHT
jgi:acyl-CoA synthetase (NDP forming)